MTLTAHNLLASHGVIVLPGVILLGVFLWLHLMRSQNVFVLNLVVLQMTLGLLGLLGAKLFSLIIASNAAHSMSVLPLHLLQMAMTMGVFLLLAYLYKSGRANGLLLPIFLLLHEGVKSVLEIFRDPYVPEIAGFSTIMAISAVLYFFVRSILEVRESTIDERLYLVRRTEMKVKRLENTGKQDGSFKRVRSIGHDYRLAPLFMMVSFGIAQTAYANISLDIGVISMLRVDAAGSVAVSLYTGYPNAGAICGGVEPVWAHPDPLAEDISFIKSTLLAAKASGANVSIAGGGCDSNGVLMIDELLLE